MAEDDGEIRVVTFDFGQVFFDAFDGVVKAQVSHVGGLGGVWCVGGGETDDGNADVLAVEDFPGH